MTGEQIVALAMAQRTAHGLKLVFQCPDRDTPFTCYPKDEGQKVKWLATADKRGWVLVK